MWGPTYFALVVRLGAYAGVVAARIAAEENEGQKPPKQHKASPPATGGNRTTPATAATPGATTVTKIEGTRAAIQSHAASADLFDWE